MTNRFAGTDIIELGIEIEKNGRDFYNTLASQSKDSRGKEVFEYLAGEEQKHIAAFQKILDSVYKQNPPQSCQEEYLLYMNALASEYVFTQKGKGREIAKKITTDREAVDFAIGFEKDSILFYQEMKNVVPEPDNGLIDKLITEEKSHIMQLFDLRKSLQIYNKM